jgi:hypothetical protein
MNKDHKPAFKGDHLTDIAYIWLVFLLKNSEINFIYFCCNSGGHICIINLVDVNHLTINTNYFLVFGYESNLKLGGGFGWISQNITALQLFCSIQPFFKRCFLSFHSFFIECLSGFPFLSLLHQVMMETFNSKINSQELKSSGKDRKMVIIVLSEIK